MALLSERMALLGDPTRIRILDQLWDGERNVQSIADALLTTQQNVSGHLRLLRAGGLVTRRPVGREVFYAAVTKQRSTSGRGSSPDSKQKEQRLVEHAHQVLLAGPVTGPTTTRGAQPRCRRPGRCAVPSPLGAATRQ